MGGERRETILVVDDQASIRKIVKVNLRADYDIVEAEEPRMAMEKLGEHEIDLILCDVRMPGVDGFQFREQLLASPDLAHIPFIYLTSLSGTEDKVQAYELDATDFITKPFKGAELKAKVKSVLSLRGKQRRYTQQERLTAIRKMVVTMNHEINNPLTTIVGMSELILRKKDTLPEDVHERLGEVHRAAVQIREVVKALSKIEELSTKTYLSDVLMFDIEALTQGDSEG